jgi:hypothetical protein
VRTRRVFLALAIAICVAMGGTAAYAAFSVNSVPAAGSQDRILVRGGVVRLGTTVQLHTNSTHAAVGITGISLVNRCDLRIAFDRGVGEQVVSAQADEDERVSQLQVQAGISGGNGYANVYLYRNGQHICANNSIFGTTSNLWIHMTYLAPADASPTTAAPAQGSTSSAPTAKSLAAETPTPQPEPQGTAPTGPEPSVSAPPAE